MLKHRYILITSARNEELLIEATIKSVISQTQLPQKWFIVSDNSTDRTDKIVQQYADNYHFIEYIRKQDSLERDFSSKAYAINMVLQNINYNDYDFIGILDADITFEKDYYRAMLIEFGLNSKLGIAGGEFYDVVEGKKIKVVKSLNSVRGGIQLFRKQCFQQIGRFTPLKYGGEDIVAEVLARKNGWLVKSFESQILEHHRLTGTAVWGTIEARFRDGILAYSVGYHPLFQFLKSIYRIKEKPYIISGLLRLSGFIWANIKREDRVVNIDFINYLRREQFNRILSLKF